MRTMVKINWATAALVALVLAAGCVSLTTGVTDDGFRGDFGQLSGLVNPNATNAYRTTGFLGTWKLVSSTGELLQDGISISVDDNPSHKPAEQFTLKRDWTVEFKYMSGTWGYTHNALLFDTEVGMWAYEVISLTHSRLTVRWEPQIKDDFVPFWVNPGGLHYYVVCEFKKQ